jgi:hypothetical protein
VIGVQCNLGKFIQGRKRATNRGERQITRKEEKNNEKENGRKGVRKI